MTEKLGIQYILECTIGYTLLCPIILWVIYNNTEREKQFVQGKRNQGGLPVNRGG